MVFHSFIKAVLIAAERKNLEGLEIKVPLVRSFIKGQEQSLYYWSCFLGIELFIHCVPVCYM